MTTLSCPRIAALLCAAPFFIASPGALAQSESESGPPHDHAGNGPHGPPPEAIAACNGKTAGTVASFTGRDGQTISGPCTQMGDVLAVPPPQRKAGNQESAPASR